MKLGILCGVRPSDTQLNSTCSVMHFLKFSKGNAKLSKRLIFNLPAGHTCPNAGVCRTMADPDTGKIQDAPRTDNALGNEFRCFAAMAETRPAVRAARWHNFNAIKDTIFEAQHDPVQAVTDTIALAIWGMQSVDNPYKLCRIHESGDFFSFTYFLAWLQVAREHREITFYAYTKQLAYWLIAYQSGEIPDNFYLTASMGGDEDYLLDQHPDVFRRVAVVVYTEEEAAQLGFEIDHDDSHCFGDEPFALLVHNNQRKGSDAAKALAARRRQGSWTGYSN